MKLCNFCVKIPTPNLTQTPSGGAVFAAEVGSGDAVNKVVIPLHTPIIRPADGAEARV